MELGPLDHGGERGSCAACCTIRARWDFSQLGGAFRLQYSLSAFLHRYDVLGSH